MNLPCDECTHPSSPYLQRNLLDLHDAIAARDHDAADTLAVLVGAVLPGDSSIRQHILICGAGVLGAAAIQALRGWNPWHQTGPGYDPDMHPQITQIRQLAVTTQMRFVIAACEVSPRGHRTAESYDAAVRDWNELVAICQEFLDESTAPRIPADELGEQICLSIAGRALGTAIQILGTVTGEDPRKTVRFAAGYIADIAPVIERLKSIPTVD